MGARALSRSACVRPRLSRVSTVRAPTGTYYAALAGVRRTMCVSWGATVTLEPAAG